MKKLYTATVIDTDKNITYATNQFTDKDQALNWIMNMLFQDLGNGGMTAQKHSDGSIGSLWRCADEIYDSLKDGIPYYYADREYRLDETEIEDDSPKKYIFRYSTVLNTSVVMEGNTYEGAKAKADSWANKQIDMLDDEMTKGITQTEWDTIGYWCDEGDEEIE